MTPGIGTGFIGGFQSGEQSRANRLAGEQETQAFDLQQQQKEAEFDRFTEQSNRKSMVQGALEFKNITDPAEQDAFLLKRIDDIKERGGDPRDTIELFNMGEPEARKTAVDNMIAIGERFGDIKPGSGIGSGKGKPTANIQDFKYYQELSKTDPAAAEQFARQTGISEKKRKELKPTTAQQNFDIYNKMPEGREKEQFGTVIGIKPNETPAHAMKRAEKTEQVQIEMTGANQTIKLANQILDTEGYLDKITGITGSLPSMPGSTAFDADVIFNQLKNSLTLDNLSKMSGVLSDSDIKILQSAGAGMEFGMSRKALENRLKTIMRTLKNKIKRQEKKIGEPVPKPTATAKPKYQEGQTADSGRLIFKGGVWRENI